MRDSTELSPMRGEFFSIDSRIWAKVCDLGLNEAVAYLVLAQGTGRDNRKTSWSVTSLKRYVGISWERGSRVITRLIQELVLRHGGGHTDKRPRYELLPWNHGPTSDTSVQPDSREHLIWIPNSVVTGTTASEESPIRRLRGSGDAWALRLFIDLYHSHNLRDDGGISPRLIRMNFERQQIGQQGFFLLWTFKRKELELRWSGPFEKHKKRKDKSESGGHPIWQSVETLRELGLVTFVPHLWENGTDEAEIIHPYGMHQLGEPLEREIAAAAHRACCAMALQTRLKEALAAGFRHFSPVMKTFPNVQMIGVARLTYRPHTERTSAWFRDLLEQAPKWIAEYQKLEIKAQASQRSLAARIG